MAPATHKPPCRLLVAQGVLAVILVSIITLESRAQDAEVDCPCFKYEEVESIFLRSLQMTAEEGTTDCGAQDYTVECSAEVVIWDQDYGLVAHARVDWFDFDPGGCEYIDTSSEPEVERNVTWPHPAPEGVARACYDIISSVIAKSDSVGKCSTY